MAHTPAASLEAIRAAPLEVSLEVIPEATA